MTFRCIARSLPPKQRRLYDGRGIEGCYCIFTKQNRRIRKKKMCECAEEPPEKTNPTVTYKATPKEVFVTNYDEDEECISCSA